MEKRVRFIALICGLSLPLLSGCFFGGGNNPVIRYSSLPGTSKTPTPQTSTGGDQSQGGASQYESFMSGDALPQETVEEDYAVGYYSSWGGYFIEDYRGPDSSIRLPSYIDGEYGRAPVVGIAHDCFNNRTQIKTVVMSPTIKYVEANAFSHSGIKYLYLGPNFIYFHPTALDDTNLTYNEKDGVYYLPNESNPLFYAAGTKLTLFYPVPDPSCQAIGPSFFPEAKASIPYGTFAECTGLEFVSIPGRISSVGQKAFPEGVDIETFYEGTLEEWLRLSGKENFRGTVHLRFGEMHTAVSTLEIPEEVESLGSYAFSCCRDLTSIKGKGITSIGDSAFWNCSSLSSIEVSPVSAKFGAKVFEGCTALREFTIPEGTTEIGDDCFAGCATLSSLTLPASIKTIGERAFANCTGLTSITLPEGLETIEDEAFIGCTGLTEIVFPASLKTMGNRIFKDCGNITKATLKGKALGEDVFVGNSKLKDISYQGDIKDFIEGSIRKKTLDYKIHFLDDSGNEVDNLVVPSDVTEIKADSFANCPYLTQISLPSSVTTIRDRAFKDCTGLTKVTIPSSVTFIGQNCFAGDANISEISLPFFGGKANENNTLGYLFGNTVPALLEKITLTGCAKVADSCFKDLINIGEVALSSPIQEIGKSTFQSSSLTKISLPSSLTKIGENAFYRCEDLTSIEIPSSVTEIGVSAFKNCLNLSSVIINSHVLTLGSEAFRNCSKLQEIVFNCSQAEYQAMNIGQYAFPSGVNIRVVG